MRKALAIFALLSIAALAAFAPPKPKVGGLTVTVSRLATSLLVKGCWTAGGGPDGFVTASSVTGQASQSHTLGVVACDSFTFAAPAPSVTVTISFSTTAKRRGLASSPATKTGTYTEPDVAPPAPIVDSLIIRPASLTVLPGSATLLCQVWKYTDGTYSLSTKDNPAGGAFRQDTIPACRAVLTQVAMGL